MPSDFTRSPKFLKGALVAYESQILGPIPNIIVFQYNPESLNRSLAYRAPIEDESVCKAKSETLRVQGPPEATITTSIVLNAADQLEEPLAHPFAVTKGINPALAALELLLYPPESQLFENKFLTKLGSSRVSAEDAPLVLFVWGPSRVVPVRLTSFSVTEEAFDQMLNPIQAKVDLGMKILTYMELKENSIGYGAYMATQTQKEVMARLNMVNNIEQVVGMLPV